MDLETVNLGYIKYHLNNSKLILTAALDILLDILIQH